MHGQGCNPGTKPQEGPPQVGIASSREAFQRRAGTNTPLAAGSVPDGRGGKDPGESEWIWV